MSVMPSRAPIAPFTPAGPTRPMTLEQRAQMREDAAAILERDAKTLPKEQRTSAAAAWRRAARANLERAAGLRAEAAKAAGGAR